LANLTIINLKLTLVACTIHGIHEYKFFFVTKPVVKIQLEKYKWKHNMEMYVAETQCEDVG
jgi:hypothetical protein